MVRANPTTTTTDDEPDPSVFAGNIAQTDLATFGPKVPPHSKKVVVGVLPRDIEQVDEIAARHGFERVGGEMDRRTYLPASDDLAETEE